MRTSAASPGTRSGAGAPARPFLPVLARWGRLAALLAACALGGAAHAVDSILVLALFKNKAMVEIDGKQRLLKAGQRSPEGVLLVSATSEAAVLEMDGKAATYPLGTRISAVYPEPEEKPPVRIYPTTRGMYTTTGSINGYPVNFVVDTGATFIAMNRNEARRLGIDYRVQGEESVSATANGMVVSYVITLDKVRIGHIELRNVTAAVVDGDSPPQVLLGNSFLNRLDMRRKGDVMEFRQKF